MVVNILENKLGRCKVEAAVGESPNILAATPIAICCSPLSLFCRGVNIFSNFIFIKSLCESQIESQYLDTPLRKYMRLLEDYVVVAPLCG